MALISIAHPDVRSELLSEAKQRRYVFFDQIEPRSSYEHDWERPMEDPERGALVSRPIRETDESKIADMFYSLSAEAIHTRYHAPLVALPRLQLMNYMSVDDRLNVAFVLETRPEGATESEIIGVASYHAGSESLHAEVSVLVRDDWQGRGYGKHLFGRLVDIAKGEGFQGFVAEVLVHNRAMLQVFRASGLPMQLERDSNSYSVTLRFDDGQESL
jgi:RimJ/RimL family protein N-acetyltransferase